MRQPHLLLFLLVGCNDDQPIKLDPISFPEGSEEEVGDVGSWLSMAPTADGKPAIAYYDRTYDALGFAVGTISSGAAERVSPTDTAWIQILSLPEGGGTRSIRHPMRSGKFFRRFGEAIAQGNQTGEDARAAAPSARL